MSLPRDGGEVELKAISRDVGGSGDAKGDTSKTLSGNGAGKSGSAAAISRMSASMRSQRVATAKRGFLRCRQLPVVLDLMEDRVQSRLFTVVLFMVIVMCVLRTVLFVIFLGTPYAQELPDAKFIRVIEAETQSTPAVVGMRVFPTITVRVVRSDGTGIANTTVSLVARSQDVDMLNAGLDLTNTSLDRTGLPVGYTYQVPGVLPDVYSTPLLSGDTTVTDSNGFAKFRALKFERALPSTYQLFFDAPGANVTDADVASVTLARDVAELQLLGKIMPSELRPLAVSIGEPLSAQPRVRVLDKLGRPLVGKRVVALSTAPIFEDYTFAFLHEEPLYPRHAHFANFTSLPSNTAGVAVFEGLSVTQSALRSVRLMLVCETVVLREVQQLQLADPVPAAVRVIVSPGPSDTQSVVEGEPFPVQPAVRVLDESGYPVVNVTVFAFLMVEDGAASGFRLGPNTARAMQAVFTGVANDAPWIAMAKRLVNFESAPTNEDGVANFTGLGLNRAGPAGLYAISFACQGVWARPTKPFEVQTTVASIKLEYAGDVAANNVTMDSPFTFGSFAHLIPTSGLVRNPPAMVVTDAAGKPLSGKYTRVEVREVAAATNSPRISDVPYVIREWPRLGNARTGLNGRLGFSSFTASAVPGNANNSFDGCVLNNMCQSTLRVLVAPRAVAWLQIRYVVDGVSSDWSSPFLVGNSDAPHSTRAAYIGIGKWSIVTGRTTGASMSEAAVKLFEPVSPWNITVTNSFGVGVNATVYANVQHTLGVTIPMRYEIKSDYTGLTASPFVFPIDFSANSLAALLGPQVFPMAAMLNLQPFSNTAAHIVNGHGSMSPMEMWGGMPTFVQLRLWAASPSGIPNIPAFVAASDSSRYLTINNEARRIEPVQQPSGCVLGQPLEVPPVVKVVDLFGEPLAGVEGYLLLVSDADSQLYPSYLPSLDESQIVLPFMMSMPIFGGLRPDTTATYVENVVASGPDGILDFSAANITFKPGHPGPYTLSISGAGLVGTPLNTFTCANPIVELDTLDVSCATPSVVCPSNNSDVCSGHGACQCGICACQQGWEGWVDCSVPSDIDPFAVQCKDNPVITVGTQIPYWLFGAVQIEAKKGATAENVQVRANIVNCRGEPVPGARVTTTDCVERLVDGNSVYSDPAYNIVDNTGTAFFASTSYFASSMPTGCYAFVYSFYSTSTKNIYTQKFDNVFQGAVLSKPMSRSFRVISPVQELKVHTPPSARVALGVPFQVQPVLELVMHPSLDELPDDTCSPKVFQMGDLCAQGVGTIVLAKAFTPTGDEMLLSMAGQTSDCTRANTSNYASFETLMVPKDAVTGFSGPAPIYAPMGAGPLTLVFQARGTDSVAIPIFVTDTPDLCRVSAGIPQPPVVLDTVMESVAVFCGLTDGTPMPGVLVNSALRELVNGSCTGAKLTTSGRQSGVTGTDGVATFTDIIPVYGSTGKDYCFVFTAASGAATNFTADSAAAGTPLIVNLVNPVSELPVTLVLEDADGTDTWFSTTSDKVSASTADLATVVSTTVDGTLMVCSLNANGDPVGNTPVSVSLVLDTGEPAFVNLNFVPAKTTEGYIVGVDDRLSEDLFVHYNGVKTGDKGCFITSGFSFSGAASSMNFTVHFESRGVVTDSPFTVELFTFDDAYSWSLSDLSDGLWIPTIISVPLMLANSLFFRLHLRVLFICLAITSLALLVVYGYLRFWPQLDDLKNFFPSSTTDWVLTLNIAFMVTLAMALVVLLFILVSTATRWCKRRRAKGRRRTGSGAISRTSSGRSLDSEAGVQSVVNPMVPRSLSSRVLLSADSGAGTVTHERVDGDGVTRGTGGAGFFSTKQRKLLQYAREVTPRFTAQLWDAARGSLTPAMEDAIATVYAGYLQDGAFEARRFNRDIEECHLGPYRRGISSADDLAGLMCWRASNSSVVSVMQDLAPHTSTVGSRRSHDQGRGGRRSRRSAAPWFVPDSSRGQDGADGSAFTLTRAGHQAVADVWERLFNGHKATGSSVAAKLLGIVPVHTDRGRASLQYVLELFADRVRPRDGIVQDRLVWEELRYFGFTRALRMRVVTPDGDSLSDPGRAALQHAMATVAADGGQNPPSLTFLELNRWLLALNEDLIPLHTFLGAAGKAPPGKLPSVDADGLYVCLKDREGEQRLARGVVWRIVTCGDHGFDGCMRSPDTAHAITMMRWREQRDAARGSCARRGVACRAWYADGHYRCARRVPCCRRRTAPYGVAGGDGESNEGLSRQQGQRASQERQQYTMDGRRRTKGFFFPQRMLVSFALSLLLCAFTFLFLMSVVNSINESLAVMWQQVGAQQASAVTRIEEIVAQSVLDVQDDYAQELQLDALLLEQTPVGDLNDASSALSSASGVLADNGASDAASAAAAAAAGADTASSAATGATGGINVADSVAGAAGEEADTVISKMVSDLLKAEGQEQFDTLKAALEAKLFSSALAGGIMSCLVVLVVWALMFSTYQSRIFKARLGTYALVWHRNKVTKAVNYVGLQMSQTVLGFVMFFMVWTPLIFAVQYASVDIGAAVEDKLLSIIGISLLLSISQFIVMNFLLVKRNIVQHRRLFMLAEFVYTLLNLFNGALVALLRLIVSILFFGVTFMRCDVSQLPMESQNWDPGMAAYNGMQMVDMYHNHPIKWAFCHILIVRMKARSKRRSSVGDGHGSDRRLQPPTPDAAKRARARNRWHLFLTLHRNPSLRQYRRRAVMPEVTARSRMSVVRGVLRKRHTPGAKSGPSTPASPTSNA